MKRSPLLVTLLLVLLGALVAGCAPTTAVEAALQATNTPAAAEDSAAVEAAPAGSDADSSDTEAESSDTDADSSDTDVPELAMLPEDSRPDSECIECHSNAEQLQLLAEEEEVKASLSEGSG